MKQFGQCRYSASKSRRWNWDKWPERLIQPSTLEFYDLRKCAERLKNIVKTAYRIIGIFHIHFIILQIWGRKAASVQQYIYTYILHTYARVLSCLVMSDLLVTPWSVACQALLSMGFPKQEYWSGLPFFSPRDLSNSGIKSASSSSPALAGISVCVCTQRERETERDWF